MVGLPEPIRVRHPSTDRTAVLFYPGPRLFYLFGGIKTLGDESASPIFFLWNAGGANEARTRVQKDR
jgi:hypothetical protein